MQHVALSPPLCTVLHVAHLIYTSRLNLVIDGRERVALALRHSRTGSAITRYHTAVSDMMHRANGTNVVSDVRSLPVSK